MKATLSLEFIGANTVATMNGLARMLDAVQPGLGSKTFGSPISGPWVAEITGRHPKLKYERTFLRPSTDYSKANSKGSRGVYRWFVLESDKLYQVHAHTSWKNSGRYFCSVTEAGDIYTLNDEEVEEWLSALSASTS